jgi:antitoxin (DNA-binding transcriptional repressor) of toxin-antitoxin stability system
MGLRKPGSKTNAKTRPSGLVACLRRRLAGVPGTRISKAPDGQFTIAVNGVIVARLTPSHPTVRLGARRTGTAGRSVTRHGDRARMPSWGYAKRNQRAA